jgi:glycosyltransferase involved in cell wall biosynthesis
VRILYHHRTLADGAEGIHIAEIVEALRSLGHDVQVVGPVPSTRASGLSGRVHALRAALPETLVQAAAVGYNVPDYFAVSKAIDRFRPDLMYKRHGRYDVAALVAAKRRGIPVILEVNAVYSARPYRDFEPLLLQPVAERLERRAFSLATTLYAVSTPMARQVAALGRGDVLTLPNGANPERFDPNRVSGSHVRARLELNNSTVVGWTGILRDWHGLDLLLRAMANLPDITLLLVGDGPARGSIEKRARELGMWERVRITGRVPHADVPQYIAAMDIAVVVADHTGVASPMKLLEYMAMRRAVVAPRTENILDIIQDDVDGALFAPKEVPELSSRIRWLAADGALRKRLGLEARRKITTQRNWRAIAATAMSNLHGARNGRRDEKV